MFNFFKKIFRSSNHKNEQNNNKEKNPTDNPQNEQQDSKKSGHFTHEELKKIASEKHNNSYVYSHYTETEAIQKFFNQFNDWFNNRINLNFSKYYTKDYKQLINNDIKELEDADLQVFKFQQILDKIVKDADVRKASFELFTGAISLSDYSKKTLKALYAEMDTIKGVKAEEDLAILKIKEQINKLLITYNVNYDKYHKMITPLRLNFMKAIEAYTTRIRSVREN